MTSIPVDQPPRFGRFDENELTVIGGALASYAHDILADAEREEIEASDLEAAGATFFQALVLAYEVADHIGEDHPSLEHTLAMAETIAEGDAPLAAKMAAEAVAE